MKVHLKFADEWFVENKDKVDFRSVGEPIYFAEDVATATVFGVTTSGMTGANSVTVIKFDIPKSIAVATGLDSGTPIGSDLGLLLSGLTAITAFNTAMMGGYIQNTRLRVR